MKLRCAILDDYQGVALDMADWSRLSPEVEVQVFREKIDGLDNLVRDLKDFDILCLMRERTPIPAKLIEALPKLRSDNVDGRPKPVDRRRRRQST